MRYLIILMLLVSGMQAGEMREKKIVEAVNTFIHTMQYYPMEEGAEKIVPMLHFSMLDKNGECLNPNIYTHTFPKIHKGAQDVLYPVMIKKTVMKITFGRAKTYGKGEEYKIWLATKPFNANGTKTIGIWIDSRQAIKITAIKGLKK